MVYKLATSKKRIGMRAARWMALFAAMVLSPLVAAESLGRKTVWDLKIGAEISQQPGPDSFQSYACGANGGPPRRQLGSFAEFMDCAPEPSGLREVYFEYDDEQEYVARALQQTDNLKRFAGTAETGFPLVVSALFDAQGILRGIRLVTDPRPDARNDAEADLRPRTVAHQFGALMAGRFDVEPARDCQTLPLENGESAVGGTAIKLDCLRIDQTAGRTYRLSVRLLRKAGQSGRDPRVPTQLTRNQFESMARLEIMEGH